MTCSGGGGGHCFATMTNNGALLGWWVGVERGRIRTGITIERRQERHSQLSNPNASHNYRIPTLPLRLKPPASTISLCCFNRPRTPYPAPWHPYPSVCYYGVGVTHRAQRWRVNVAAYRSACVPCMRVCRCHVAQSACRLLYIRAQPTSTGCKNRAAAPGTIPTYYYLLSVSVSQVSAKSTIREEEQHAHGTGDADAAAAAAAAAVGVAAAGSGGRVSCSSSSWGSNATATCLAAGAP